MRIARIGVAFVLGLAGAEAVAQAGPDARHHAMEKLRACAQLGPAERMQCLEKVSNDIAPSPGSAAAPAPAMAAAADNWIVSETTTPLDYSPAAIATASSGGPDAAGIVALALMSRFFGF